jgi:excisionase family DNA binding protein
MSANNLPEGAMSHNLFTCGEAAAQLGLPRWKLQYLIERGEIPGPSHQVPGRRLFTFEDIRRIAQALAESPDPNRPTPS